MQLLKKLLKRLAQLIGAMFGLAVVLYLIAVVINWKDVPPSELAVQFEESLQNRPAVADEDNAFIAIANFSNAPAPYERIPRAPTESEFAVALHEDCHADYLSCLREVARQQYGAGHWLEEHQWILDRYIAMLVLPEFKEPIPNGPSEITAFGDTGYAQRLLMMSAMLSAVDGDQPHVIALLEADLKFWRMVLANSDLLITKMIAADYVRAHFLQGNEVLRELHKTRWQNTLPLNWLNKITADERSLRRALIGEWHFGKYYHEMSFSEAFTMVDATSGELQKLGQQIKNTLLLPMYQTQDNKNVYAADLQLIGDNYEVPMQDLPAAFEDYPGTITTRPKPYSRLFNIAGDIYLNYDFEISYRRFFARTYDLEGIRQAAVVTTLMREQGLDFDEVPDFLVESEIRSPYTNEPFTWDGESEEIQFDGLGENQYEVHSFQY